MFSLSPTERQTLLAELDRLLTQSSLRQRLKGNPQQRQMLQRLRDLLALTPIDPTPALKAEIAALKAERAALQAQLATAQTPNPNPLSTTIALTDFSDRTHQLLSNLDSSLQLVFTTLSRHLQTYELDLTQGLDRLHNLSTQTEPLLTQLLTQLLQAQTPYASSPQIPIALAPEDRITTLGDLLDHLRQTVTVSPPSGQTNNVQDFRLEGMDGLLDPPAPPADMATITLADVANLFNDLPGRP
jgi:aminoglycoside phosphotransferase